MGLPHGHHNNPHYHENQANQLLNGHIVTKKYDRHYGDQGDPEHFPERKCNTNGDCFGGFHQQPARETDQQPPRDVIHPASPLLGDHGHAGGNGDLGHDGAGQKESANSGSIANTARRLGKSRSAVSTSIAALEVELGVELFERGANQSRLTEIGELVLDDCTRLLLAANSLQQKCKHYASGAEVALQVARDDAIPEQVWREMLASLHNQFPVSLWCSPLHPHCRRWWKRDSSMPPLALSPKIRSAAASTSICSTLRTLMVVTPSHPLAGLKRVKQQDLTDHPQVTLSYVDEFCVKSLLPVGGQHIGLSSFELMRNAVLDGLGWAGWCSPRH